MIRNVSMSDPEKCIYSSFNFLFYHELEYSLSLMSFLFISIFPLLYPSSTLPNLKRKFLRLLKVTGDVAFRIYTWLCFPTRCVKTFVVGVDILTLSLGTLGLSLVALHEEEKLLVSISL